MVSPISPKNRAANLGTGEVTQLQDVAETLWVDALEQARMQLAPQQRGLLLENLLSSYDFVERLKYHVAIGIANVLATFDERVEAVYLFDPSANPDTETGEYRPLDPTVSLFVVVAVPSAGLNAFVASLDRALTQHLNNLPYPLFARRSSLIEVVPISRDDIQRQTLPARLLSSIFAPPLRLWTREP